MRVITEAELREQFKQADFTSFQMPPGTRLTPSAHQFLSERRIKVLESVEGTLKQGPDSSGFKSVSPNNKDGYTILATGESLAEKPEHMTHLRGKALVPKNHPIIKFRGKLDSFQAALLAVIIEVETAGYKSLARDLEELLDYARKIMSAEVREKPLEPLQFHGLTQMEIRERSHNPGKFYGTGHILPQPAHGKLMARLNLLRAQWRELEVAGIDAFDGTGQFDRPDILQALNRVSSLIYIMMVELTSGNYKLGN